MVLPPENHFPTRPPPCIQILIRFLSSKQETRIMIHSTQHPPRKPRRDGWTSARCQKFLNYLAAGPVVRRACARVFCGVGISPSGLWSMWSTQGDNRAASRVARRVARNLNRHPELGSGSISPPAPPLVEARWMLNRVQHNGEGGEGVRPLRFAREFRWKTIPRMVFSNRNWCRLKDSNPWPPDYKSGALPTELSRHSCLPYRFATSGRGIPARLCINERRTSSPQSRSRRSLSQYSMRFVTSRSKPRSTGW